VNKGYGVRIAVLSDVAGGFLVWVVFKILPLEFSYDVRTQFSWLCGSSEINHQLFQYCPYIMSHMMHPRLSVAWLD
jgi:hypothetical protein